MPSWTRTLRVAVMAALLVTACGGSAGAQASPRAAAKASADAAEKKKAGDDAFRALQYAEALRAYDQAYALVPNPALHYNRGRTLEALERYPEAVDALEAFEREASPALRARASAVSEHIQQLKKRVAAVRFIVKPEGARIRVRDVVVGTSPLTSAVRVAAGKARIEVEADGFLSYSEPYGLPGDAETTLTITLSPTASGRAPIASRAPDPAGAAGESAARAWATPASGPSEEPRPSASLFSRWWFWTAASAVVVGAAAVTYVVTRPSEERRQGDVGQLTAPLVRF